MLKLLECENCHTKIGKDLKYKANDYNGVILCNRCYKEALKNDKARNSYKKDE